MENTEFNIDTSKKHVFITGASGCVGHYLIQECLKIPDLEIHLLARNPDRLKFKKEIKDKLNIYLGDFQKIQHYEPLIRKMNYIIHTLTAWWGDEHTNKINVTKTKEFFLMTDPDICEQIVYFSTASLLTKNNAIAKEASLYGSDYIKSKYNAYYMIKELPIADKITVLFPTMVFGGDKTFPQSHITKGISETINLLKWIKHISLDGAFHFMHSSDIAQVATHLMTNPKQNKDFALGNEAIHIKNVIKILYTRFSTKPLFTWHISHKTLLRLIKLFRIKIGKWEKYCIDNSYMVFNTVTPQTFGLNNHFENLDDILKDIQSFTPELKAKQGPTNK